MALLMNMYNYTLPVCISYFESVLLCYWPCEFAHVIFYFHFCFVAVLKHSQKLTSGASSDSKSDLGYAKLYCCSIVWCIKWKLAIVSAHTCWSIFWLVLFHSMLFLLWWSTMIHDVPNSILSQIALPRFINYWVHICVFDNIDYFFAKLPDI